ncbi:MAG: tRNA 2-thiocytidine(32) synthetase TtcA [Gammaproteobacteria bacterium]|nr:tRNA 2-thiocytidine(32) synthetase TtcA [Gammaproteobacteria bacterium]
MRNNLEKKLLHYTGKAIADYKMITTGDKVLVCLSGGKDSYVLTQILHTLQKRTNNKFTIKVFCLDQGLPKFDATEMRVWLETEQIPYLIHEENTLSIVKKKTHNGNYCMLCSRLRRGIIYRYATENGFNKIALGHHRDDLITSLLMSIFYQGEIGTMPPKLLTNEKDNIVIRPLCYCQEKDIKQYSLQQEHPIFTENLCEHKENPTRKNVAALIQELAKTNPKIPSNILHALQRVRPSQLMDRNLFDFNEFHIKLPDDIITTEESASEK